MWTLRFMCSPCAAGLTALSLFASLPAAATEPMAFFGTWMNTNPTASPAPPCNAQVINQNNPPTYKSAGFSNLGDFVFNLVQCLAPPSGNLELDFGGGNTLFGTWGSTGVPSSTPLVSQVLGQATLTGGTGAFAGYSGSFDALGYLDRRDSAVTGSGFTAGSAFVFRGEVAPVPEPAAWGLLFAGLAVVGIAARRGSRAASRSTTSRDPVAA